MLPESFLVHWARTVYFLPCLKIAFLLVVFPAHAYALDIQPEASTGWHDKHSVRASQFMVSAANPLAARVGYEVLKRNGTAIDAMVAVQMMLNLVEPQSSGLGGGAFLLYWDAQQKKLTTYDGRETAPAAVTSDYFLEQDGKTSDWWQVVTGGRSVGVPGTLRLLEFAHKQHGHHSWPALIEPTIKQARQGFIVSPRLSQSIRGAQDKGLAKFAAARDYFFTPEGEPVAAGELLKNPEFANTLEHIAREGAGYLYRGVLAQSIVDAVANNGAKPGLLALEDLANYKVKVREPVCSAYRAYRVCGMGPPSSGALTVGQILGLLERFDVPSMGVGIDSVHVISEAAKLAFADRSLYMADSDFVSMPTRGLLDRQYLNQRAQLIDVDYTAGPAKPGQPPWEENITYAADQSAELPGTSHISIVDQQGNIVSMTTTIETGFGSRLMVGGFLLNNELTDFSFVPEVNGQAVANRIEGGKRPRSSMAPSIVFDENQQPVLVIGSPGGSRIINYVAKTIVAVLDWDMDIQEAINLGHFTNRNGITDLEISTRVATLKNELEARGQSIELRELNSGLHGIVIQQDGLIGGADPRREGVVLGD